MKKRKRKTTTRLGNSRFVALLLAVVGLILVSVVSLDAGKKKEKPGDAYSVVAGTVFREPGYALPDADVTLAAAGESGAPKGKKLQFSTNTRGEFAFRIPSVAGRYVVSVSAKGYEKQQKIVEVQPSERVDVTFCWRQNRNSMGIHRRVFIAASMLVCLGGGWLAAQSSRQGEETRTLEGRVLDASSAAVQGAVVQLKDTRDAAGADLRDG